HQDRYHPPAGRQRGRDLPPYPVFRIRQQRAPARPGHGQPTRADEREQHLARPGVPFQLVGETGTSWYGMAGEEDGFLPEPTGQTAVQERRGHVLVTGPEVQEDLLHRELLTRAARAAVTGGQLIFANPRHAVTGFPVSSFFY